MQSLKKEGRYVYTGRAYLLAITVVAALGLIVPTAAHATLILSLLFSNGSTTMDVSQALPNSTYTIDVWATIVGTDTSLTNDGLDYLRFGVRSSGENITALDGDLTGAYNNSPFAVSGSIVGTLQEISSPKDHTADLGGTVSSTNAGWDYAYAGANVFVAAGGANGNATTVNGKAAWEFKVATLTFTVHSVQPASQLSPVLTNVLALNPIIPQLSNVTNKASWKQDGVVQYSDAGNIGYQVGSSLTFTETGTNDSNVHWTTPTASFGRVMLNQTPYLNGIAIQNDGQYAGQLSTPLVAGLTLVTPGWVNDSNTVYRGAIQGQGDSNYSNIQSQAIYLNVNAAGSGTTGAKNWNVTLSNNTNSTDTGSGKTLQISGTVVDNRLVTASTVAFGRVMQGYAVTGTSNLTTLGDNNHFTALTVNTSGGADPNGISVPGGTGTVFNGSSSTGTRTVSGAFTGTGSFTGAITLGVTGEGLGAEVDNPVTVPYSVVSLANRVVTTAPISLGRVMVNTPISVNSKISTANTAAMDNSHATTVTIPKTSAADAYGMAITDGNITLFSDKNQSGSRTLSGTFTSTGYVNNTLTLYTVGEGLPGESPINVNLAYSAAVVANRVVTATPISLGRVMYGYASSANTTLTTTGDANHATSITVAGSSATDVNGASIYSGTNSTFNSDTSTSTDLFGGVWTGRGALSGTLTLVTTGEGLVGEAPINVNVNYSATVLADRVVTASVVDFGNVLLHSSDSATSNLKTTGDDNHRTRVTVATTAGSDPYGVSISGGTGTAFNSATSAGTRVVVGTMNNYGAISGTITLTTTGEGLPHEAPNNVGVTYTANVGLASTNGISFGNTLSGTVGAGSSFASLASKTTAGTEFGQQVIGSEATILDGVNVGSAATIVTMAWRARTAGESAQAPLLSDVVDIEGTGSNNPIVVQMSYDPSAIAALVAGQNIGNAPNAEDFLAASSLLQLTVQNASGTWQSAAGYSIGFESPNGNYVGDVDYNSSYFTVGDWGVDSTTHTAWAVVNNGGKYAVSVIPEPSTIVLMALGAVGFVVRRTRRGARG